MAKYWFDHVHILSKDPLKTAEFYEKSQLAKRESVNTLPDGRTLVSLSMEGPTIKVSNPRIKQLVPGALPDGCGLEHFGMRTDNIDKAMAELKAKGVKFVQEITQINPKTRIAFFASPEGILVELMEVKA